MRRDELIALLHAIPDNCLILLDFDGHLTDDFRPERRLVTESMAQRINESDVDPKPSVGEYVILL